MTCARYQEWATLSLYGELEPGEERALEAHLRECGACREVREALAGTVRLLKRRSAPLPGARRAWRRWAAAAALLLGAAVARFAGRTESQAPPEPVRTAAAPLPTTALPGILETEDRLCALMAGTDPFLALEATESLGRAGTRRSTPALRAALGRPVTRLAAFRALRARGELDLARDVVPALGDPTLRRDAAAILTARRTAAALAALFAAAVRGDETCLAACRSFPASVAGPFLAEAAGREDGRGTAIGLLLSTDGDDVREVLVRLARADGWIRAEALARAAAAREARSDRFLVLALADAELGTSARDALADVPVRRLRAPLQAALREDRLRAPLAAFLQDRAGEEAARDLLAGLLGDTSLRPAAARALLAHADLRAVEPLLLAGDDLEALDALPAAVRRREIARALRSPRLRAGAVAAVSAADASVWRDLVPLLRVESLRAPVAAALSRSGATRAIPFLIPLVSPEGRDVREALVALAGVDAGETADAWNRWWNDRHLNP
ncbi:MAG: zf-HC2 domain-containing protein [Planctomycetes bacterium]|nr:zf-HC2 domain-containing protein [Planctomycetota bacterium]